MIRENDTLISYGFADVLEGIRVRKVGLEGDREHVELMLETAERQAEEDSMDHDH